MKILSSYALLFFLKDSIVFSIKQFDGGQHSRRFTFDSVFNEASSQDEVFQYCGIKRLVDMAIEGYITTCFAYGQTGSGKTHTMIGAHGASIVCFDCFAFSVQI